MSNDLKTLINTFLIFLLCALVTAASALLPFLDLIGREIWSNSEYMGVEVAQELILIAVIAIQILTAVKHPEIRPGQFLLTGFFSCMLIRELDFLFDKIHHGFWLYLALGVTLICLILAFKSGRRAISNMADYCRTPGFHLVFAGLLTIFVFSRIIGTQVLWREIMGDNYMRIVKDMVEETTELMGYTLILMGTVWRGVLLRRRALSAKKAGAEPVSG